MIRVIIVDDEQWSVIGIKKAFDWEKYGFQVIGELISSVDAFEMICSKKPELVITDIRMPIYSGIDLMKMTKEKGICTEFVVISGFAEFSYAQEALRLGALDYFLKPLDIGITDKLLENLQKHFSMKGQLSNNEIFEALLSGDNQELYKINPNFTLDEEGYWRAAIIYLKDDIHKICANNEQEPYIFVVKIGAEKYLCLMKSENLVNLAEQSRKLFIEVNYTTVGLSSILKNVHNISKLIKEADIAALKNYVINCGGIFEYSNHVNIIKPEIDRFISLLKEKQYKFVHKAIDDIKETFYLNSLGIAEVVYFWNRVMGHMADNLEDNEDFIPEFLNYEEIKERFIDFQELCVYLGELLVSSQISEDEVLYGSNYDKLIKYIHSNYNKELYLKDISSMFYINQTYVCQFFKKRFEKTFSEYVTELRINKACELIRTTNLGIGEIAVNVGYSDYYYFNKIFKKICKITPAKYKRELNGRDKLV